jgi:predicted RNA-binding Zn ribbon-like protein
MGRRAPGPLGLVQDFVNTYDADAGADEVGSPEALGAWLRERGLLAGGVPTPAEHAAAIELREALRRLLAANNGAERRDADLGLLGSLALAGGLRPRFAAGPAVLLEPAAGGMAGALGQIVAAAAAAINDGTWGRLKACAEETCGWAFYDASKNQSGHWCSMATCGNRAKARQFRQRHRPAAATTS